MFFSLQTRSLYFLPGVASTGHGGGRHEYPSGQEGPDAERFPHVPVPARLVLHKEPGEGPASSGRLSHGQSCFISSRLHHRLTWIHVNCHWCLCRVYMCSCAADITGIQKPRSRLQGRHLWNMPPYGSRNGGIPGKESGIHEGVGPGKWLPDVSIGDENICKQNNIAASLCSSRNKHNICFTMCLIVCFPTFLFTLSVLFPTVLSLRGRAGRGRAV